MTSGSQAVPLDRPGPVRAGEELDAALLGAWLAERVPELAPAGGGVPAMEVAQFGSGYSNLTYFVRVGERELVLRRPPVGSRVATAHDMGREYTILAALSAGEPPAYGLAPRPLDWCDDPAVLGAPFYVMERVAGVILRAEPPPGIDLGPANARRLSEAFADHLARLHAVDIEAAGLAGLGRPGYLERQIRGWGERWRAAAADGPPEMDKVAAWLAGRVPELLAAGPSAPALVHNDFKYDNLVLDPADPARVVALLDWEMATVGDPLLDLGTALGYWVEAGDPEPLQKFRFGPTHLPGSLTRRELAERYAEASGRPVADLPFAYAFGLFKIAVIAQQIYVRFRQGLTRDPRFAALPAAVRALARRAAEAAASGGV